MTFGSPNRCSKATRSDEAGHRPRRHRGARHRAPDRPLAGGGDAVLHRPHRDGGRRPPAQCGRRPPQARRGLPCHAARHRGRRRLWRDHAGECAWLRPRYLAGHRHSRRHHQPHPCHVLQGHRAAHFLRAAGLQQPDDGRAPHAARGKQYKALLSRQPRHRAPPRRDGWLAHAAEGRQGARHEDLPRALPRTRRHAGETGAALPAADGRLRGQRLRGRQHHRHRRRPRQPAVMGRRRGSLPQAAQPRRHGTRRHPPPGWRGGGYPIRRGLETPVGEGRPARDRRFHRSG